MNGGIQERVKVIQISVLESAQHYFSGTHLDDLRCLIRLTVEFQNYLQYGNPALRNVTEEHSRLINEPIHIDLEQQELAYANNSTFSGIDPFRNVTSAYNVLIGATKSEIAWDIMSVPLLKELFFTIYREFEPHKDFLKRCRLLLDLFKIQIVLAGVSYD